MITHHPMGPRATVSYISLVFLHRFIFLNRFFFIVNDVRGHCDILNLVSFHILIGILEELHYHCVTLWVTHE